MDGAGTSMMMLPQHESSVAMGESAREHKTTLYLQPNHHDGTTHRTLRQPYHSCAITHKQPYDAQKNCLRHFHTHSTSHFSVFLAHSRRLLRALRTMSL
jgi:hypothetical protein